MSQGDFLDGSGFAKELFEAPLVDEMKKSYLSYAMSVIVGRALPDARDGLKPVHRRILFAMHELGISWNKAHKKSARVVGDVIGKYHPHGDTAVYDTMVRLAQDFSLRYPLIDGQGNFGSVDGDNAAAMRYTEARLSRIAHEMLADIDKDTVDFVPNYDGSEREPSVLPTRFPGLLVNGSAGIAVGMATNIPPHNLGEVIDGCLAQLANPAISIEELMKFIPAPDFPTAALVWGVSGAAEAYKTGKGSVVIRARTHMEEEGARTLIVVDELPYQVNKRKLQERIAELVRDKEIEGISDIRDESDKDGMRLVIEVRRESNPEVVLNQLFKSTQMQDTFGVNMVALVDGQPKLVTLKEAIEVFLRHRREVIYRRSLHDLAKAKARGHVLEGLAVALSNLDLFIEMIKTSATPAEAKERLGGRRWPSELVAGMLKASKAGARATMPDDAGPELGLSDEGYALSALQIDEILGMNLRRLTGMEQDKIQGEYKDVLWTIDDLTDILANAQRITAIIAEELAETKKVFGDERRSEIVHAASSIEDEDLIPRRQMVVTLSKAGYIKAQPSGDYAAQRRGGRGKSATDLKEDDLVAQLFAANSHSTLLCFSTLGRAYPIKIYALPSGSRGARGKPIANLFDLEEGEKITSLLPIDGFKEEAFILMVSRRGIAKRVPVSSFRSIRQGGLNAIALDEGDLLAGAIVTRGDDEALIFTTEGKAARLEEQGIRALSRSARGTRGIRMPEGVQVLGVLSAANPEQEVLTVSRNGYGKRTQMAEFRKAKRGAQGVRAQALNEKTGPLVAIAPIADGDEVIAITDAGVMIRIRADEIRESSRASQGVRLIRLEEGQTLADFAVLAAEAASFGADEGELGEDEGAQGGEPAEGDAQG